MKQTESQASTFRRVFSYTLVFAAAFLITIVVAKMETRESKRTPTSQQLRWYALESKKQNKNSVSVPRWQALYAEPNLDEVLRRFTVMVVEPVTKRTYETSNGNRLVTWNKLRILEVVSSPEEAVNDTSQTPPEEMLPLNRGEILIQTSGGAKLIEGIEVNEPGPNLKEGQRYLVYVLLNSSSVGLLAHGDTGISLVAANGKLEPFRLGFKQGETLEALKDNLKTRHSGGSSVISR
ncbi:MAG TPA: hypothetical protein VGD61_06150 [Pyrinomonadaceae bacterium]